ncbi:MULTISPECIES: 2'-5' RNA ligase family protein [unclassified Ruegeria]|uniref:2'-5' RNA ligase family protein n=1 Tax=unclassified Ruegeria TaxID=2625375 RepID=UPI00148A0A9E|nr:MULTISPECIES: 2'-5' RNA ligase family protein [unclassified Ruegeria]NOD64700.1 hypothetical protein [Ruegeria sp. HKCCD6109]NOD77786.1 hypothetical protein [Ruegeria sp. HKCCD4332]NOD88017.1 hypothetical protein [Ruegeria sp. HKCCD4318]NOE14865.1 hypothetical protein [Ruegeria sp. HKCCD4318-2]NOG11532.1 2'-5' RNA ligase family protein [Ruegeria sp. HKCCD4315]
MKANVASFSIWMLPEEPLLTDLSKRIKRFADANGTPSFIPHVTLVGDIAGEEAELKATLGKFSAGLSSCNLTVTGIGAENVFFKSLYLDLAPTADLVREQEKLASALPASQRPRDFLPHVSVAYGPIAPEIKSAEAHVYEDMIGTQISFRRLHLVRSSQNVPVEDWNILQSFDLASI